jgi:hypothetical protein
MQIIPESEESDLKKVIVALPFPLRRIEVSFRNTPAGKITAKKMDGNSGLYCDHEPKVDLKS